MFGLFKKKDKKVAAPAKDPLAVYDGFIEQLDRQGAEVRRSAATLLALRGELSRDVVKYGKRIGELEARVSEATVKNDARAKKTLQRDLEEAKELLESSQKALTSTQEDSVLLMEAAEDLSRRATQLKSERASARARIAAGQVVSAALRQQVEEFDRVMALDAARDEVEKAHALADIYREDASKKPR